MAYLLGNMLQGVGRFQGSMAYLLGNMLQGVGHRSTNYQTSLSLISIVWGIYKASGLFYRQWGLGRQTPCLYRL
ncbi:hypothetical protein Hanom_Chr05g00408571 [Helianthus anomalus]